MDTVVGFVMLSSALISIPVIVLRARRGEHSLKLRCETLGALGGGCFGATLLSPVPWVSLCFAVASVLLCVASLALRLSPSGRTAYEVHA